jgi:hypothetical protein
VRGKKFRLTTEQNSALGVLTGWFAPICYEFRGAKGLLIMQKRPEQPTSQVKDPKVRDQSQTDQGPEIDSELQAHIGRHLKASYDDILGQDVPDRFRDLLAQLEAKTDDSAPKGGKA